MRITRKVLQEATPEQWGALRDMFQKGQWEGHDDNTNISYDSFMNTVMVSIRLSDEVTMLIGIEKDGYTHS